VVALEAALRRRAFRPSIVYDTHLMDKKLDILKFYTDIISRAIRSFIDVHSHHLEVEERSHHLAHTHTLTVIPEETNGAEIAQVGKRKHTMKGIPVRAISCMRELEHRATDCTIRLQGYHTLLESALEVWKTFQVVCALPWRNSR
jgi:hypothetical protein